MRSEKLDQKIPLLADTEAATVELPAGLDRRAFMMRCALFGATAVITGCAAPTEQQVATAAPPPAPPALLVSEDLNVVKKAKGPVMTTLDEFYKVGPGPSSSHTIGPMRITYDFYQRCTKLPPDQLAKVTGHEGAPVWQPERDGKGARHRTRGTRRRHRQRASDGRTGVPRQPGRRTRTRPSP